MKTTLIQLIVFLLFSIIFYLGYTTLGMTFEEAFAILHIVSGALGFIGAHILLVYIYVKNKKRK